MNHPGYTHCMFSELSRELLPIYLNDHLAAATGGVNLAKRAAAQNCGDEFGEVLHEVAAEGDAHRNQLEDVMARLEISRDQAKVGAAWLAERLGRLKLNGRLIEYSPLSRVVELEALILASQGRKNLWRTLAALAPDEPRIADIDFVQLVQSVEETLTRLEEMYEKATGLMLAAG